MKNHFINFFTSEKFSVEKSSGSTGEEDNSTGAKTENEETANKTETPSSENTIADRVKKIDWELWLHGEGLPEYKPKIKDQS